MKVTNRVIENEEKKIEILEQVTENGKEYLKVLITDGNVITGGTPLDVELFEKINGREDTTLSFKRLSTTKHPELSTSQAHIYSTSDNNVWLSIPETGARFQLNKLSSDNNVVIGDDKLNNVVYFGNDVHIESGKLIVNIIEDGPGASGVTINSTIKAKAAQFNDTVKIAEDLQVGPKGIKTDKISRLNSEYIEITAPIKANDESVRRIMVTETDVARKLVNNYKNVGGVETELRGAITANGGIYTRSNIIAETSIEGSVLKEGGKLLSDKYALKGELGTGVVATNKSFGGVKMHYDGEGNLYISLDSNDAY